MKLNESIRTTVHSYNKAYDLFEKIRELWDNLEGASDYQYMEALDKVEDLIKQINKVDLNDMKDYLEKEGKLEALDDVRHNLNLWKEGAYQIGREILGWSFYEDLIDSLPRFISALKKKFPTKYDGEKNELVKQFASIISHPENVERYKNNIESIIRGNMTIPYFARIYDALIDENDSTRSRTAGAQAQQRHPNPPEMFSPEGKAEWAESQRQSKAEWEALRNKKEDKVDLSREKPEEITKDGKNIIITPDGEELEYDFVTKTANGVITYLMGKKQIFSYLGESFGSFVSLSKYNKLFESLAYICATCGERAEHEEIEDNPNLMCPNCGDSNWEMEY